MKINLKKSLDNAMVPHYGSDYAAGGDLYAVVEEGSVNIAPGETAFIHTGIHVEIPVGYYGAVYARSGLSCKQGLAPANKVGIIDSDYRGEIMVALYNQSDEVRIIKTGDRIAQMIISPFIRADYVVVDELDDTARGNGGFGSTGK